MTTVPHYITSLDYLPFNNIFVPSELPSNNLMILLHGYGGKAEDFTWIPEYFNFDNMHYLLLDALDKHNDGYTWYDENLETSKSIENISKLLEKTFELLFEKDFNIIDSFLFGFSQGGLLVFECGARYQKKFSGYIMVSGCIEDEEKLLEEMYVPLKDAHWLCTHGLMDEELRYEETQKQMLYLEKNGFNIEFKGYAKAHNILFEEMNMIKEWMFSKMCQ